MKFLMSLTITGNKERRYDHRKNYGRAGESAAAVRLLSKTGEPGAGCASGCVVVRASRRAGSGSGEKNNGAELFRRGQVPSGFGSGDPRSAWQIVGRAGVCRFQDQEETSALA